jgi:hypothetical protein
MLIRLKKISDATHRLVLVRDDGTGESIELVSRSFLQHDLLHFSVETNAKLQQSFWGLLAAGRTLAQLHEANGPPDRAGTEKAAHGEAAVTEAVVTEAVITEAVVGVLTNVVAGQATARAAVEGLARLFEAQDRDVPAWFTAEFVERVREHMRKLTGQWRALPYGDEIQLTFGGEAAASRPSGRTTKSPPRIPGRARPQ